MKVTHQSFQVFGSICEYARGRDRDSWQTKFPQLYFTCYPFLRRWRSILHFGKAKSAPAALHIGIAYDWVIAAKWIHPSTSYSIDCWIIWQTNQAQPHVNHVWEDKLLKLSFTFLSTLRAVPGSEIKVSPLFPPSLAVWHLTNLELKTTRFSNGHRPKFSTLVQLTYSFLKD